MSKLKELIDRLCPNGVPFKPLGEVCGFINGFAFKSSLFKNEGQRIIRITNIDGININLDDCKFFSNSDYRVNLTNFQVKNGDILIAMSGATTGKIGSYNYDEVAYINQRVGKFTPNENCLNNRFLYHFLRSQTEELYIMAGGGAQPNLSSTKLLSELILPVPPLEVQEEIVRILDTFSAHTAELQAVLQAELQARKEQYEYYRNLLLTFNSPACGCGNDGEQETEVTTFWGHSYKIVWKTMGEVCSKICSGGTPSTSVKAYYNGNIPWMRTQEVDWKEVFDTEVKITEEAVKNSSAKMIPINCVIIAMYGATAAKCCINKIPLTTNQACCNLQINPQIADYRYVYQYICNEYKNLKAMGEGSQSNINSAKIRNYRIPIPPLELQEKIVAILDRFETLVNDLTQGLPAEIAAVKERYEYYRNKLLTFKHIA